VGDENVHAPAFFSYTVPEPEGLIEQQLTPEGAFWAPEGGTAIFLYDDLHKASSPKAALLEFLESAYQAGIKTAGWYIEGLRAVPVG